MAIVNKNKSDSLGDRIKGYENIFRNVLIPKIPVIIRLDGKTFHTYTKGFRPFDPILRDAMIESALSVAKEMQGFELAYHQSDEVSFLLTDYATHETSSWFNYNVQKMVSVSVSVMTAWFNRLIYEKVYQAYHLDKDETYKKIFDQFESNRKIAYFDGRAFSVPKEDVSNAFLWRAKDWERNSISMYCRQFFSAKELHGKGRADQHEMLHQKGKNWATDVLPEFRNGTFIFKDGSVKTDVVASYPTVSAVVEPHVKFE